MLTRSAQPCMAERGGNAGNLQYMQLAAAKEAVNKWSASEQGDADVAALRSAPAFPVILHLDSIKHGGHQSATVHNELRQWLRYVWTTSCRLQSLPLRSD
jgi:hypothetical protein